MTRQGGFDGGHLSEKVRRMKSSLIALLIATAGIIPSPAQNPVTDFDTAIRATASVQGPPRGSVLEQVAIDRFATFLGHLDEQTVRNQTGKVYAPDAYLNDMVRTIHGSPAIRDYLLQFLLGQVSLRIDDVAVCGRNYYFRWTMETRRNIPAGGKPERTLGISLIRFDPQGRVILHQDFWDATQDAWTHSSRLKTLLRWIQSTI